MPWSVYRTYLPYSYTLTECLFLQGRDLSVRVVVLLRIELLPKAFKGLFASRVACVISCPSSQSITAQWSLQI